GGGPFYPQRAAAPQGMRRGRSCGPPKPAAPFPPSAPCPPRKAYSVQRVNPKLVVSRRLIVELYREGPRQTSVVSNDLYLKFVGGRRLEKIFQAGGGRKVWRS